MCDNRIIPSDWMQDAMQKNALRVETISVSNCAERCILKPPENWSEGAKKISLNWLFSGGSPLVFGECTRCKSIK